MLVACREISNGSRLAVVHAPIDGADVLNGIAYDSAAGRIYNTGKLWPTLYALALPDHNEE